jgi:hypothetical protein
LGLSQRSVEELETELLLRDRTGVSERSCGIGRFSMSKVEGDRGLGMSGLRLELVFGEVLGAGFWDGLSPLLFG